jgi:hypothetical protein
VFSELGSDFDKLKRSGALEMMSYLATKANPPAP